MPNLLRLLHLLPLLLVPAHPQLLLRVIQFADLHFGEAENLGWGPAQDVNSTRVMRAVLAAEGGCQGSPTLVVFSGDQITGNNVGSNATAYSDLVLAEAVAGNCSFASIFGNHDDAPLDGGRLSRALSTTTRRQLLAHELQAYPALSRTCGAAGAGGCPASLAPAVSNYYQLVLDPQGRAAAVLYFLDSGGGDFAETLGAPVTAWLAATAAALAAAHGPLPSLTFVHIPPPEYAAASSAPGCQGMAEDGITPTVGPNALLATLLATAGSAARAISVGHDHGNANCCPYKGLSLCFGRHTGYGGYGSWDRGARVFELSLDASARGGVAMSTHVRMEDGSVNSQEAL